MIETVFMNRFPTLEEMLMDPIQKFLRDTYDSRWFRHSAGCQLRLLDLSSAALILQNGS